MFRVSVSLLVLATCLPAAPEAGYRRGQVHPDFELPKVGGGSGKLSDYRGKPLLLFNFASW